MEFPFLKCELIQVIYIPIASLILQNGSRLQHDKPTRALSKFSRNRLIKHDDKIVVLILFTPTR